MMTFPTDGRLYGGHQGQAAMDSAHSAGAGAVHNTALRLWSRTVRFHGFPFSRGT